MLVIVVLSLISINQVLEENVRHRLHLGLTPREAEILGQATDHLPPTDPAMAPIIHPGPRGRRSCAPNRTGQILGVQQGLV